MSNHYEVCLGNQFFSAKNINQSLSIISGSFQVSKSKVRKEIEEAGKIELLSPTQSAMIVDLEWQGSVYVFNHDECGFEFEFKTAKRAFLEASIFVDDWYFENFIESNSLNKIPCLVKKHFFKSEKMLKGFFKEEALTTFRKDIESVLHLVTSHKWDGPLPLRALHIAKKSKIIQNHIGSESFDAWISRLSANDIRMLINEIIPPCVKVATYTRHFPKEGFFKIQ